MNAWFGGDHHRHDQDAKMTKHALMVITANMLWKYVAATAGIQIYQSRLQQRSHQKLSKGTHGLEEP
eukprot:1157922-Pelagomonas_calceolata.AAC.11